MSQIIIDQILENRKNEMNNPDEGLETALCVVFAFVMVLAWAMV
jgi:hypothetical protein